MYGSAKSIPRYPALPRAKRQTLKHLPKNFQLSYNPVLSTNPILKSPRLLPANRPTTRMSASKEPTAQEATELFEALEHKFPSKTLGAERWYLVAV